MSKNTAILTANLEEHFRSLRRGDMPKEITWDETPSMPNSNYAPSQVANTKHGLYKQAGGGIIYGQPQFFSPVHTPMNWQIPSKRKEIYQWSFVSGCNIMTYDGSYKKIEDVEIGDMVMSHNGIVSAVDKKTQREVSTTLYTVKCQGYHLPFKVTKGHKVYVIPKEKVFCKYCQGGSSGTRYCDPNNRHYMCTRTGCTNNNQGNVDPELILVEDVKPGDFMYMPIPRQTVTSNIDEANARLLGYYCAEGCVSGNTVIFTFNINEIDFVEETSFLCKSLFGIEVVKRNRKDHNNTYQIEAKSKELVEFCRLHCPGKAADKKLSKELVFAPKEIQENFLATYWNGDGCQSFKDGKEGCIDFRTASKDLADQVLLIATRCGYPARVTYSRTLNTGEGLAQQHSDKEFFDCYTVSFTTKEGRFFELSAAESRVRVGRSTSLRIYGDRLLKKVESVEEEQYDGIVYDVRVPSDFSVVCNSVAVAQCRFYYENEAKIASSIDFYSLFPVNGFQLECKNRYVKRFYEKLVKKLNLSKWLRVISHEAHLLGDAFPFTEIECTRCQGSGSVNGQPCDHPNGVFKRLVILNPEYVEVFTNPLSPDPVMTMIPDDELKTMILKKIPGHEKLSPRLKAMIISGQPIPLDNRCVSHIKYGNSGYNRYGTSLIRRLFPVLAYKTKLMTAQWIVAERLIIPIKIVKVGSDERPAGPQDIANVQAQLAQTANDPNLTLVTHHAFELDFFGASGKVLQLSNEFDLINQEILDGMMINKALLNGEGPCFHPDVEILTEKGWKFYNEVEDGEKLATFNPKNNALEYQHFKNRIVKHYEGDMYNFRTNKVEMLTTANHRMWVQERTSKDGEEAYSEWKVVPAEEVKYRSKMRACVDLWEGNIPNEYSNGVQVDKYLVTDMEAFSAFMGYYIAEGWANEKQAGIAQKTSSPSTTIIREFIDRTGIHYNEIPEKTISEDGEKIIDQEGMTLFNFGKGVALWLMANCPGYALEKRIPTWIKNLPVNLLTPLLDALMDGDGCLHKNSSKDCPYRTYVTASKNLADDVMEISMKLGYASHISYCREQEGIYLVCVPSSEIGKFPVLDTLIFGNKTEDRRKCISTFPYNGTVWCFEVPNEFLVVRLHGKPLIAGNTYSNAAIGVEAMIDRLEAWRSELKEWVEEKIFLQMAIMWDFKEKNEWGEMEYIYPKLKWNIMHLRDQQNYRQFMLQLHEKGLVSAQRVLDTFDIDYDEEIDLIRFERSQGALGVQQPGAGGGMGGGAGGLDGGMGDIGGGMDGGGAPGGMEGGMGGGMEGGGAPGGAPTAMASTQTVNIREFGGRVLKPKTRDVIQKHRQKLQAQQQGGVKGPDGFIRGQDGRILLTSPERELMRVLIQKRMSGDIKYQIIPQFPIKTSDRQYSIDFAIPQLQVAIEVDGEMFHSNPEQLERDKKRDTTLSQKGWTTIRFTESEIDSKLRQVTEKILTTIMQKEAVLLGGVK